MTIPLLISVLPVFAAVVIWLWLFNSRIEPRFRQWVSKKYNVQIKRKQLNEGYWWTFEGSAVHSTKITLWTIAVLVGIQYGTIVLVGVITDMVIQALPK